MTYTLRVLAILLVASAAITSAGLLALWGIWCWMASCWPDLKEQKKLIESYEERRMREDLEVL